MTRASTILFWFSLTIIVSLGLYHTSYRVEELGRQLRTLNAGIENEQRTLHVLKAEWVYLANPARIENAARKHLSLQPTVPKQISNLNKLSDLLPTRTEAMGSATVEGSPIASLKAHPAAHSPKVVAEETGRVNTRLVIRKAAASEVPVLKVRSLKLAEDSTYAYGTDGSVP